MLKWADCSKYVSEPSDVAIFEGLYYVTDYKQHRVVVFNIEGTRCYKLFFFLSFYCNSAMLLCTGLIGSYFFVYS